MKYKITNHEFAHYTGPIGKTNWVNGECENITDPMDVDMVRLTLGIEAVEIEEVIEGEETEAEE